MDVSTGSRKNLAKSAKWVTVLAGFPFFSIKTSGAWRVASTADKSQVSLQLSQAANGKKTTVVKEGMIIFQSPYFSPQHCLDLHIPDFSKAWAGSITSRERHAENLKFWSLLEQRWSSCLLARIKVGMEISQKEAEGGQQSGQKDIKATLPAWRHTSEAHERELQGRPLGLRKYQLMGRKLCEPEKNVNYSCEIFSPKISILSCIISNLDYVRHLEEQMYFRFRLDFEL